MILLFPDLDTLKLALAGGIVGPDVTLAPAILTVDTQGRLYVEPERDLSKATAKQLDRIGVKGCKRHGSKVQEKVANWLQIVPLYKNPAEPELASQTPVLFELESADDLPVLVSEMLRLGNDKQSFRWFETDGGSRVLLRVLGPPFYTLLRALERTASGTAGAVRAYLEPTPRVWIEYGFTHPFAAQIRVPEGQLLLLRSPRHWLTLDESPFQDVYEILKFDLPQVPVGWNESVAPEKISVPLKLAAGNAADVPELWVLREDALDQLDAFVRDADAGLTQRLAFAVAADAAGKQVVVLRTRPSKLPPPVLPFETALGFKPFWKLPNLFLPSSKRLHPTLRRDAVRRLLADDPDQVVWLQPDGAGGFTPESVPDAVFRPLEHWVDYIVETNQQPLAAWIKATTFDFDSFACSETGGPKPKPKSPEETDVPEEFKPAKPAAPPKATKGKAASAPKVEFTAPPEPQAPSAWRIRRESLEEQFLAAEGPLDSAERLALWPRLAEANAGEGSQFEAAVCWLNAMWVSENACELAEHWFRVEYPGGSLDAKEFERRLASRKPSIEDLRAVVAGFLWLSYQSPVPRWLQERLPAVQAFFETHEGSIPVRAVWLVALRQAHLAGADVLGLARVRDRLLLRLLEEGLRAERDLPTFLRYAGLKDSNRLRVARDKALELHALMRKWCAGIPVNAPFIDLYFAFALARLGEQDEAHRYQMQAWHAMFEGSSRRDLDSPSENASREMAQTFFFPAFAHRIERSLGGAPHQGAFPAEVLDRIDAIRALATQRDKEKRLREEQQQQRFRLPTKAAQEIERIESELSHLRVGLATSRLRLAELKKGLDYFKLWLQKRIVDSQDYEEQLNTCLQAEAAYSEMESRYDRLEREKLHWQGQTNQKPSKSSSSAGTQSPNQREKSDPITNAYMEAVCCIDRLRQESRILEPNEVPDPYRGVKDSVRYPDEQYSELLRLTDLRDPKLLGERIRKLYTNSVANNSDNEWNCRIVHTALTVAPRVGESFVLEQLRRASEVIRATSIRIANPPTRDEIAKLRGEIVDRALRLAAQYNQVEFLQRMAIQFADLIRTEPEESRHVFINAAMGQCLRTLKKLGMRDVIDRLLARVQSHVFASGTVQDLREKYSGKPDAWSKTLQTLLHLAGGWLMLGQTARANEVLDAARAEVLARKLLPNDLTALAQAYIAALGHGPSEAGIERIKEFFEKVPASAFPNNWTGSKTYSRLHLKLIEEVVHAVTSDEFALGPAGRRWLDEDEYLVRNKIHADLKQLRATTGV